MILIGFKGEDGGRLRLKSTCYLAKLYVNTRALSFVSGVPNFLFSRTETVVLAILNSTSKACLSLYSNSKFLK